MARRDRNVRSLTMNHIFEQAKYEIDEKQFVALLAYRQKTGTPLRAIVRDAIRAWLVAHPVELERCGGCRRWLPAGRPCEHCREIESLLRYLETGKPELEANPSDGAATIQ